jgi:hypothetical protein
MDTNPRGSRRRAVREFAQYLAAKPRLGFPPFRYSCPFVVELNGSAKIHLWNGWLKKCRIQMLEPLNHDHGYHGEARMREFRVRGHPCDPWLKLFS